MRRRPRPRWDDAATGLAAAIQALAENHKHTKGLPLPFFFFPLWGGEEVRCTADGYTGDEVCTVCEEIVKQGEVIPATGHSWDEGVVKTEPGCCEEGVMHYTCTVCGETKEENISPRVTSTKRQ